MKFNRAMICGVFLLLLAYHTKVTSSPVLMNEAMAVSIASSSNATMETMLVATNTMTTSPNAKTETMPVAAATVTSSPNVTTQTMPVITNTVTSTSIINSGTPTSAMTSSASSTTEIRPSPTINHMSTTSAVAEVPTIVYIQFEVTFALEYRSEYSNSSSSEYRELALNLTLALTAVFKEKGRKGFQGIQILGFRKGSVVCSFLVVVDGSSNLDANSIRELLQAEKGQLGMYKVENINVVEGPTKIVTKDGLPDWGRALLIFFGVFTVILLGLIWVITVQCRRANKKAKISGDVVNFNQGHNSVAMAGSYTSAHYDEEGDTGGRESVH